MRMKTNNDIFKPEENEASKPSFSHINTPSFEVPEGYFAQLPQKIVHNMAIIDAAEVAPNNTLQSLRTDTAYTVPADYFNTLASKIIAKATAFEAVVEYNQAAWDVTAKATPYATPENYFEQLEQSIFAKLQTSTAPDIIEDIALSATLSSLKSKNAFAVPEGYFQSIEISTYQKIHVQPESTQVVEHPAVKSIRWSSIAAAAMLFVIFGIGGWLFLGNRDAVPGSSNVLLASNTTTFDQMLNAIPEQNIKEWLAVNMDESDFSGLGNSLEKDIPTQHNLSSQSLKEIELFIESEAW
jgi:hypothetical protein